MVNIRKLVAFDAAIHGDLFVITEFALGLAALVALGAFAVLRDAGWTGWYLIGIGLNYAPLLFYALVIERNKSAASELAADLDRTSAGRRYGFGQLILLVPLACAALAAYQELAKKPL